MSKALEEQYKKWNQENKLLLFNATWHSSKTTVIIARKIGVSFMISVLLLLVGCMLFASYRYDMKYPLVIFGSLSGGIFIYQNYWAIRHKTLTPFGTRTFIGNHARDLAVIELFGLLLVLGLYMYWNYMLRSY